MLPFNDKWNIEENEKPIPYGLTLVSIQWQKEFKGERETNSFRIQTCFLSLANGGWKRIRKQIPYELKLDSNQWQKELKEERETNS